MLVMDYPYIPTEDEIYEQCFPDFDEDGEEGIDWVWKDESKPIN